MTPPTAPERCPTCDKPRAECPTVQMLNDGQRSPAEVREAAKEYAFDCRRRAVDWRARALAAEARCEELRDVKNASLAVTYAAEEWYEGRISDDDLRATVRLWCDEDGGAELAERIRSAQAAAARWAKVAPLIERLREAASVEGGDMMAVVAAACDLLAATEVTP